MGYNEIINLSTDIDTKKQTQVDAFSNQMCNEFFEISKLGELVIRENIKRLEDYLCDLVERGIIEETEMPLIHHFSDGVYMREIFIPKDTLIVGKIHRHAHLNFMSSGSATVLTKDGAEYIKGPKTMLSSAGTKRALYTHEDTVWTTVHHNPTNTHDIEEIEEFTICKDYSEFPLLIEEARKIEV